MTSAQLDIEPNCGRSACGRFGDTRTGRLPKRRDGVLYVNPGSAGPRRFKASDSVGELVVVGDKRALPMTSPDAGIAATPRWSKTSAMAMLTMTASTKQTDIVDRKVPKRAICRQGRQHACALRKHAPRCRLEAGMGFSSSRIIAVYHEARTSRADTARPATTSSTDRNRKLEATRARAAGGSHRVRVAAFGRRPVRVSRNDHMHSGRIGLTCRVARCHARRTKTSPNHEPTLFPPVVGSRPLVIVPGTAVTGASTDSWPKGFSAWPMSPPWTMWYTRARMKRLPGGAGHACRR